MYSRKVVLALVGFTLSICLGAVFTVLPQAEEGTQLRFDVPEEIVNKVCGPRSGPQVVLANWKEKISVHPLTLGAKLTLANKALFGKAETSKQSGEQLMYLYGYKPEGFWKEWQTVFLNDKNVPGVSAAKMGSIHKAWYSGAQYAIVKKAVADTSWWNVQQYSGFSVQPMQTFEETIKKLDIKVQEAIINYVAPGSSWSDSDFLKKAQIWRDYLCVLSDISEKGGMVALPQQFGSSKPEMIYYTMALIEMYPGQEVPSATLQINEDSMEDSLDRVDPVP